MVASKLAREDLGAVLAYNSEQLFHYIILSAVDRDVLGN
jgi:hypothetical protein